MAMAVYKKKSLSWEYVKSQVHQQKTWNHSQCSGKLLLRQKLQFILLLSHSFMISFSQGSHESGESRLLVLKEEKYGSYIYQQSKTMHQEHLCIPAEYKLRSSCLVSVPHGRIETREQLLLLHCLIVPCSGPLQGENIHAHPTCQTLKRWGTEKKSLKLTGQGKICH